MSRYFVSDGPQLRARRAGDGVAVVIGVLLLLWMGFTSDTVSAIEDALVAVALAAPSWFDQLYGLAYVLGGLSVVGLFVFVLAQGSKRLDLLRDMALALAGALGVGLLLVWWVEGKLPVLLPEFTSAEPEPLFPVLRVAIVTGVIVVAAPHLSRPFRRFLWTMVILVAISGFGLGLGLPGDAVGGVGLGLAVGGVILLAFGSPKGYPDVASISAALSDLGLRVKELVVAPDQSWGVRRLIGELADGTPFEAKAYGRDATDSQVLAKAWRSLWYREEGQHFTFSRLQGVEHEALALYTAREAGVTVPKVLAVGIGGDSVALLANSRRGKPLTGDKLSRSTLEATWMQVTYLHGAGLAHGSLTLEAVSIDNGRPVLRDLGAVSFSASEARMNLDVVSLLFETTDYVGSEAAVAAAASGLGNSRLAAALPYLQLPALTRSQRKAAEKPKDAMKDLRSGVAEATGSELPEPAKLRRVRWQDLIMPALSLVAAYALIGLLSDIDFAAVWEVVENAQWALIVIGFLIGQSVFFPDATGMLFATGYPLPLRPLVVLQVSVKWIGLAVPSAAGRVGMNTLFLRRFGVPPTIAVTQGAIDGISGFVVEAGILLLAFIAGDLTLNLDTDEIRWGLILLIVFLLIVAGVVVIWRVQRIRDLAVPILRDSWKLLWGVLKTPSRALGLLGSNLASRLILAITLWFILQAIGEPLSLVTCLVVTVATNLLAGLVPIPGGIGVAEAVLTSFLMVAGLGADEAFAAAVVFRLATFYIPAGEGFPALRWLRDRDYV